MTVVNVSTDGAGQTDQCGRATVDVTCPIVSGGSTETFRSALVLLLADCTAGDLRQFKVVVEAEISSKASC